MTQHPTGHGEVPTQTPEPAAVAAEASHAGAVPGRGGGSAAAGAPAPEPAPRDLGMATAEYAITTLAACGFAGLLLVILRGGEVRGMLLGLVRRALSVD